MSDEGKKTFYLSVEDLGLETTLETKIENERKISANKQDVSYVVAKICMYLNAFNSLKAESTTIDGYDLKDIEVLNELSDFVFPDSIRFDISTYLTTELAVRSAKNEEFKFDKLEWEETMAKFRNFFKKDSTSDRTSLADLRKQYNLSDIMNRVACPFDVKNGKVTAKDFKVRYVNEAFMPIFISTDLSLWFNSYYFNAFASDVIKDMMAKKKFN